MILVVLREPDCLAAIVLSVSGGSVRGLLIFSRELVLYLDITDNGRIKIFKGRLVKRVANLP